MSDLVHRYWTQVVWLMGIIFACGLTYAKFQAIEDKQSYVMMNGTAIAQRNAVLLSQHEERIKEMRVLIEEIRASILLVRIDIAAMRQKVDSMSEELARTRKASANKS